MQLDEKDHNSGKMVDNKSITTVLIHTSPLTQDLLLQHNIGQVQHYPYSSGMTPCDFWPFSKLKSASQRRQGTSQWSWKCFHQWEQHWEKSVKLYKGPILKGTRFGTKYINYFFSLGDCHILLVKSLDSQNHNIQITLDRDNALI